MQTAESEHPRDWGNGRHGRIKVVEVGSKERVGRPLLILNEIKLPVAEKVNV